MADLHPFSDLIATRRVLAGSVSFAITDDWLQGRTSFGGLVSALMAQAMRECAGAAWPAGVGLRALQTSFVAPVGAGELVVSVNVLRQGKNICQVMAQARQHDQVVTACLGTYGADRASGLAARRPLPDDSIPAVGVLPTSPARSGQAPTFLQHFDLRWAAGPPPMSGGQGWRTSLYLRLRDAALAQVSSELQTVLLADLSPTPVIGHLSRPSPNSSVTWALELRAIATPSPADWWRADNESLMVEGGYVNHAAKLWSPDGQLAAFGYQVVAVFA